MRLLVYNQFPQNSGTAFYRLIQPLMYMDVEADIASTTRELEDYLKENKYDLIIFSTFIYTDYIFQRIKQLKKSAKVIVDVDDYFVLPETHLLYGRYKLGNYQKLIEAHLRIADAVTCASEYLADKCRAYNKRVYVIENGLDFEQWIPAENKSDRLRIGIICGESHTSDISILIPSIQKLYADETLKGKWQLVLGGFSGKSQPMLYFEQILTNGYQSFDVQQVQITENLEKPWYKRMLWKDIEHYHEHYNEIDVLLAPLDSCDFNRSKSAIKLAECAAKSKCIVASDLEPYRRIQHGINGVLISPSVDWFDTIKALIEHPDEAHKMGKRLNEIAVESGAWDINKLSEKRLKIYQEVIGKNFIAPFGNIFEKTMTK